MNEIKPHTNWAKKVYNRARAYGVIKNESGYVKLFVIQKLTCQNHSAKV